MVNLGCGSRFDPSWVNIDMIATGPGVFAHDLSRGIPLSSESCAVVYHSHLLEHIPREDASAFLQECFRVLEPGGIIRIAVPDLERIVRRYIEKLDAAVAGDASAVGDYEWMMLELYDQAVRNAPGGGMRDYIVADKFRNDAFVIRRIGEEGLGLIRSLRGTASAVANRPLTSRLRNVPGRVLQLYRGAVVRTLLGKRAAKMFNVGAMRTSGEVHQWMYDRYSLKEILISVGFGEVRQTTATESLIPNWEALNLDTGKAGEAVKPDSLYMEAVRPQTA